MSGEHHPTRAQARLIIASYWMATGVLLAVVLVAGLRRWPWWAQLLPALPAVVLGLMAALMTAFYLEGRVLLRDDP